MPDDSRARDNERKRRIEKNETLLRRFEETVIDCEAYLKRTDGQIKAKADQIKRQTAELAAARLKLGRMRSNAKEVAAYEREKAECETKLAAAAAEMATLESYAQGMRDHLAYLQGIIERIKAELADLRAGGDDEPKGRRRANRKRGRPPAQ
jgi:predicted  nucleic acid-binding Zn-ribbon protein